MKAKVLKSYWDEKKKKYLHEGDIVEVTDARFSELSGKNNKAKEALLKTAEKQEKKVRTKIETKVEEKSE